MQVDRQVGGPRGGRGAARGRCGRRLARGGRRDRGRRHRRTRRPGGGGAGGVGEPGQHLEFDGNASSEVDDGLDHGGTAGAVGEVDRCAAVGANVERGGDGHGAQDGVGADVGDRRRDRARERLVRSMRLRYTWREGGTGWPTPSEARARQDARDAVQSRAPGCLRRDRPMDVALRQRARVPGQGRVGRGSWGPRPVDPRWWHRRANASLRRRF